MRRLFTGLLLVVWLCGCAGPAIQDHAASVIEAAAKQPGVVLDEAAEQEAIARFESFFADVTRESIRSQIDAFYAPDVYFNDTLKTVRGRTALEGYLLRMPQHADFVRTKVLDHSHSGPNYYVRWIMAVRFKGAKEPVRTMGVTLLRFDKQGRVVLHQDFWDSTAGFTEHLPVLGSVLRWIKSKI
ncbi:MAG: nuclear transport factor 2 family protein [bacterium]